MVYMKKKRLKILTYAILVLILLSIAFLTGIYIQVSRDASGSLGRSAIESVIFSESPVFYDDAKTPIGVYFEKIHSKYIRYDEIPTDYVNALIAAEDGDFFNHPGFDIKAIARAFVANLKSGRVVQGGSTLTQQTAKNVFTRQRRTYIAKLRELFQALLLESRYTKQEILEMYVNQFFVTGFGKGLRIASEYFFDKDAEDLDLVESAFLAGLVKGPYRYNPFTKKTEKEKDKTILRANERKNYVLVNMKKLNLITEDRYLDAFYKEIPFKEGKVTYRLNVVLDYIREQLESEYFREILHEQGVDNIATSGIRIYTSIDKEIQAGTLNSIRKHLPQLDVKLSGYNTEILKERYLMRAGSLGNGPGQDLPFFARITQIHTDPGRPPLVVSWDNGGGTIDYDGIKEMGEAWLKWKLGEWALFDKRHVNDFLKNFSKGDQIPVRYQENNAEEESKRLTLTEVPDLEGGVIVIKNGMVKAMVGGYFDRYFNRAADAKRQLGSIFKPLVYTAALQLKWNNLDTLINMRDVFRFENTFYLPNPDHDPKSDKVSMAWAGTKSENLATVWLLYHLTDRLNMSEFRQVVHLLGLNRYTDESYEKYVRRIRDKHGVIVNREALRDAAFEAAKKEAEPDLIFNGLESALDNLRRLQFNIDMSRLDLEKETDRRIARLDFQAVRSLDSEMRKNFNSIRQQVNVSRNNEGQVTPNTLHSQLRGFYFRADNGSARVVYTHALDLVDEGESYRPVTVEWLEEIMGDIRPEDVWIDGRIPSTVVGLIQSNLNTAYKRLTAFKRYDLEVLAKVRDFRTLVNMYYVRALAREMGVSSPLDPVLSFPLGATSISVLEAALAYHTIMSGRRYPLTEIPSAGMTPVITKIVDREGEIIWQYRPAPRSVLSDHVSGSASEILRMVMENGTGRKARDAIKLVMGIESGKFHIPIPTFGKTGTANRFTNSSFAGFVPTLTGGTGAFDLRDGYVVALYVGYDDNRPMKSRHVTIYGASGALPIWIDTVNAIVNSSGYRKGLHATDLAFNMDTGAVLVDKTFTPVFVSPVTGLPLEVTEDLPEKKVRIYSSMATEDDLFTLKRVFEPFKGAP